jgi:hypothetical protein
VDSILIRMQKCSTNPRDFCVLTRTLAAAVNISSTLGNEILTKLDFHDHQDNDDPPPPPPLGHHQEREDDFGLDGGPGSIAQAQQPYTSNPSCALLKSILERCQITALNDLQERITSIVDEEATNDTVVIRTGFHEQLDAWKEQYEQLAGKIIFGGSAVIET